MDVLGSLGTGTWGLLGYLVPFLFVLTLVVFVHEMGHYLVGRWCGVGVKSFSIGFGPELFGWNDKKGTRWKLSIIPLGGYVKFVGDADGASRPDDEAMAAMSEQDRSQSFHHKSVAKRSAVVVAGPVANFIFAILIFAGTIYIAGRYVVIPRIEAVVAESAAARAGLQAGDLVVSVDDSSIESFADLQRIVSISAGEPLKIVVERAGREVVLTATPDLRENKTPFGTHRIGVLGLQGSSKPEDRKLEHYSLLQSLGMGVAESWHVIERTFDYLGKLIVGRESADQLSGPIGIAQVSGYVAQSGIVALLGLAALLSVSIGLINLFPVPLLDGGHLMFYAIEALRGRPLSEQAQEWAFRIGFALVIALMLFVTWNDVLRLSGA